MFNIVSVTPNNNATAIVTNSVISVVFNKFVKTVDSNSLYLTKKNKTKKIAATLIKVSDNEWKIIPKNPLVLNTTYVVHATSSIKSIDNDSLVSFTSQFKTLHDENNPEVLSVFPKNNEENVKVNTCVEVIFSEPVLNVSTVTFQLKKIDPSCAVPPPPPPATYTASGIVKDSETNLPIQGASVTITGADSQTYTIVTDSSGNFNFSSLITQSYSIQVTHTPDYVSYNNTFNIINANITHNVSLDPVPVEPPPPPSESDIFLMREDQVAQYPDYTFAPEDTNFENPIFVPQTYTITGFTYSVGDNSLLVFFNGLLQKLNLTYQELSSNQIKVLSPVPLYFGGEVGVVNFVKLDLNKVARTDLSPVSGSTVLTIPLYTTGTQGLLVFKNGLLQELGVDYTETDNTTVTMASPFSSGDYVTILAGNPYFEEYTVPESYEVVISNYFDLTSLNNNVAAFSNGRYLVNQFDYGVSGPQLFDLGGSAQVGDKLTFYKSGLTPMLMPSNITPLSVECETLVLSTVSQFSPTGWKLYPTFPLDPQSQYLVTLSSDITDDAGNPIFPFSSTFYTEFNSTPPTLISRTPLPDQIGVSINETISLSFSENIFNVSNSSVILLKNGLEVSRSVTTPDPNAIQIIPNSPLDFNSEYTIKIDGVTDDARNPVILLPYSFKTTFSNETLAVSDVLPHNGAGAVPVHSDIFIQFNKPVYNVTDTTLYLKDDQDTVVEATLLKRDDFSYFIKPNNKLTPRKTYSIHVDGVEDDQSNTLNSFASVFTTEYSEDKPGVLNVTPYPGQIEVLENTDIVFTFNKPVSNVDSNSFIVRNKLGHQVLGTYTQSGNIWTFSAPIQRNETYHVSLKRTIIDDVGREISPFSFTFTTVVYEDLKVKSVKKQISSNISDLQEKEGNVPLQSKFLIEFSRQPINIENNIQLNPAEYNINSLGSNTYELEPTSSLSPETDFTLMIDHHIMDDKNQSLSTDTVYHFTTSVMPDSLISSQLVNIGNNKCLLTGGFDKKDNPNFDLMKFDQTWTIEGVNESENLRNAFPVYLSDLNKVLYIGGLNSNYQSTSIFELDLSNNQWSLLNTTNAPDVIDWTGLIKVWNNNTSTIDEYVVTLGFTNEETIVRTLDLNTLVWSDISLVGSQKITQALGSFAWVNQGTSLENCALYLLGGMSSTNNNLPVKQLQKVLFYLDSGVLKYTVETAASENHILFKSALAFPNGLRTNRIGNVPEKRGKYNKYEVARLRCETIYPLDCGVFEIESNTFKTSNEVKTNVLLTFFINPPDGVVKPFIQVYETSEGSIRFTLPKVDFDYLYIDRTEFALAPLDIQNEKANKLILYGGKNEFNTFLNSVWIIEPSLDVDSSFRFIFTKLKALFTK
jgi:hypothetical protein